MGSLYIGDGMFVTSFLAGLCLGFLSGVYKWNLTQHMIGWFGIAVMTLCFCISGIVIRDNRFAHLALVALSVWILKITNVLSYGSLTLWLFAFPLIMVCMLVGGVLSLLFRRPTPKQESKN